LLIHRDDGFLLRIVLEVALQIVEELSHLAVEQE
jgi:hypothetical protein